MSRPPDGRRERMVSMYQRGVGTEVIAAQFGVRPNAVRMMLTRAGVYDPPRKRQPGTRSLAARAKVEAQKTALAEHVAEGGSITSFGKDHNLADGWVWQLWAKIRADLGAQAC